MSHPEGTDIARITELARAFPSLAKQAAVKDWDPEALDLWCGVASSGELLAAQFVLGVWNQWAEWQCGKFDVIRAYGVWDDQHWQAFKAWADKPFTL